MLKIVVFWRRENGRRALFLCGQDKISLMLIESSLRSFLQLPSACPAPEPSFHICYGPCFSLNFTC